MARKQKQLKNETLNYFLNVNRVLNDNKFVAGILILIMNIGSKHINVELSKTQENYLKNSFGKQLIVFSIFWIGTRDILISLILTTIFILFFDYLLNENSYYCIIPEKYKEMYSNNDPVTQKQINDAIDVLKRARKLKDNDPIEEVLYKENFM
jgi:hypothetical protein